jgi:uncharacterized protein YgiB involved in biofilm formation
MRKKGTRTDSKLSGKMRQLPGPMAPFYLQALTVSQGGFGGVYATAQGAVHRGHIEVLARQE